MTAGLRSNPQFYADMQQVPYRVLAPGQVDLNFAYPIDLSGKRRTRVNSAACVLRSVEWRDRDFDRRQTDNLQTLFVDTLASQVALEPLQGLPQTADLSGADVQRLNRKKAALEADAKIAATQAQVDAIQAQIIENDAALNVAKGDLRDAKQAIDDAKSQYRDQLMALGLLLSVSDPTSIKLQGWLYDGRTYPDPEDDPNAAKRYLEGLTRIALENRPDLQSQRLESLPRLGRRGSRSRQQVRRRIVPGSALHLWPHAAQPIRLGGRHHDSAPDLQPLAGKPGEGPADRGPDPGSTDVIGEHGEVRGRRRVQRGR